MYSNWTRIVGLTQSRIKPTRLPNVYGRSVWMHISQILWMKVLINRIYSFTELCNTVAMNSGFLLEHFLFHSFFTGCWCIRQSYMPMVYDSKYVKRMNTTQKMQFLLLSENIWMLIIILCLFHPIHFCWSTTITVYLEPLQSGWSHRLIHFTTFGN